MREIKFRFWDKVNKELNPVGMIDFKKVSNDGVNFYHEIKGFARAYSDYSLYSDTVELMQYTGLKDKNGKEIYEGDILSADKDGDRNRWEVVWFSGTFDINGGEYAGIATGFWVKCIRAGAYSHIGDIDGMAKKYEFLHYGGNGGCTTNDCIVIGNIYENPELLEERK